MGRGAPGASLRLYQGRQVAASTFGRQIEIASLPRERGEEAKTPPAHAGGSLLLPRQPAEADAHLARVGGADDGAVGLFEQVALQRRLDVLEGAAQRLAGQPGRAAADAVDVLDHEVVVIDVGVD